MLKILNIVGARPNFMKIAPIVREMRRRERDFQPLIVHTGQHYDVAMSDSFFNDLGMPQPDFHLEVGSHSHAVQTARIMAAFEPVVLQEKPDWVLVVGDVNSTIACALVCSKLGVKVAHVEPDFVRAIGRCRRKLIESLPTRFPICCSRLRRTRTKI